MDKEKNKIITIIPIMVVVIILGAYFFGWDIATYFNKDKKVVGISELAVKITEQIEAGDEDGVFYVTGVTEKEIININDYICCPSGIVSQYSILETSHKGMKVMFTYDISDNYYVLRKYLYGEGIPSDRTIAHKLYDKVVVIIDEIITDDMTDYEKELAIHDYIVENCEYGYTDYEREYAYRAYGVLVQGKAVCNGYAEAMALLLSCAGIENSIVTGEAGGELHAWNIVNLDGEWYQVDATWNDPLPDRGNFVGHTYFNVTDDVLDDTHVWNDEMTEDCNGTRYNYYQYNDLVGGFDDFSNQVRLKASRDITGTVEMLVNDYSADVYVYQFIFTIPGVISFQYNEQPCGDDYVITIFLNNTQ